MTQPEPHQPKVLLIGWDAADWRVITPLLEEGKMPNLQRMIEDGVKGNMATLQPVLSPMLWTSIATGKRAWKHGIHGFSEPEPNTGKIRPITNLNRKTKAIWNILNQTGKRSNIVGWWPSHPVEPINGVMVSDHFQQAVAPVDKEWPVRPGTVHPLRLQEILKDYRIHPHELEGNDLLPFIPRAAEIDQEKDKRLQSLAKTIAECSGIHAAATGIMQLEPWDFMAVYYDAIDHFCHGFMRYHPPRQEWLKEDEFDLFHRVIEGAYIYHDMMLGTLLALAGDNTDVILISDHGFHPNHLRPRHIPNEPAGPAVEHRHFGILVAKGPRIKKDHLVFGASLLDVTPTLLTLFDLPLGQDMDGKPLVDMLRQPPELKVIPSWDEVEGKDGCHPPNLRLPDDDSHEMLRQMIDLGYIDEPDQDQEKAVAQTIRELRYNLAQAYMGASRHGDAAPVLSDLWRTWPDESRFGVKLHTCQIAQKDAKAARESLESLKSRKAQYAQKAQEDIKRWNEERKGKEDEPLSRSDQSKLSGLRARASTHHQAFHFLEAETLLLEEKPEEALAQLEKAITTQTQLRPNVYRKQGECLRALKRWNDAQMAYEEALKLDEEDFQAWMGIARCHLRQNRFILAASAAQRSVGLQFFNAEAHYLFAIALEQCEQIPVAIQALQTAVSQNPSFIKAYDRLIELFERTKDTVQADTCRLRRDEAKLAIAQFKDPDAPQKDNPANPKLAPPDLNTARHRFDELAPSDVITVVSGLPRSGTSMVMQILRAGGFTIATDDKRKADESNPEGYFETALARQLIGNNQWLDQTVGKAVKIVAPLLSHLHPKHRYRVIYLERDLDEIVRSQTRMLERLNKPGSKKSPEDLKSLLRRQSQQAQTLIAQHPRIASLILRHRDIIDKPAEAVRLITGFVDPNRNSNLNLEAMAQAIKPNLYRERSTNPQSAGDGSTEPGQEELTNPVDREPIFSNTR